jgi:hypothetical protein
MPAVGLGQHRVAHLNQPGQVRLGREAGVQPHHHLQWRRKGLVLSPKLCCPRPQLLLPRLQPLDLTLEPRDLAPRAAHPSR